MRHLDDRGEYHEFHAYYMRSELLDPAQSIEDARAALADVDFDTMVGTGLSGALVIPTLARALDKRWLIVRKKNDKAHSDLPVEGTIGKRWIFVDDLIDTGAMLKNVRDGVKDLSEDWDFTTEYVGEYLYHTGAHGTFTPYGEGWYDKKFNPTTQRYERIDGSTEPRVIPKRTRSVKGGEVL